MAKTKAIPVIVTTAHKGVFFGYLNSGQSMDAKTLRIEQARMCVYWSTDVKGVVGLAASGPSGSCRIGPPAPAITLHDITAVMECSPEAAKKLEDAPWSK